MANKQWLKLTLRHTPSDRTWTNQTLDIHADPDDPHTLLDHLEAMARDLDHRTGTPWWAEEYTIRVQGIDEAWRDRTISGGSH